MLPSTMDYCDTIASSQVIEVISGWTPTLDKLKHTQTHIETLTMMYDNV